MSIVSSRGVPFERNWWWNKYNNMCFLRSFFTPINVHRNTLGNAVADVIRLRHHIRNSYERSELKARWRCDITDGIVHCCITSPLLLWCDRLCLKTAWFYHKEALLCLRNTNSIKVVSTVGFGNKNKRWQLLLLSFIGLMLGFVPHFQVLCYLDLPLEVK